MSQIKLDKIQMQAVKHAEGPVLVLGGAGSGKTTVLTNRIAYLVKNGGVKPENVLTLAFTNKEATKLSEDLTELLGKKAEKVTVCTLKQLCVNILRNNIEDLGYNTNFTLYDSDDKKRVIKECMNELNINEQKILPRTIYDFITDSKNNYVSCDEAVEAAVEKDDKKIAKCYELYEEKLINNNTIDEDDIIFKTVLLMDINPKVLKACQKEFEHILVDEYQDVRTIEHILINKIAEKNKNLFAVGNDDEGILKWKGADVSYLTDFKANYKKADIITLSQNYRMSKNLMDLSEAVIKNNTIRIDKDMTTANDEGKTTTIYSAYDEREEAGYITDKISAKASADKVKYGDFAVLYRSNQQARLVEEFLAKDKIPFKVYDGIKFYERREIKDMVSYLKVLLNDKDELSIRRVINIPKRNIGNTTLDKIDACAQKHGLYLYEALRDCANYNEISKLSYKIERFTLIVEELKRMMQTESVSTIVSTLVNRTNYIKMLEEEETQDAKSRIENINELIKRAEYFEETNEEPTLERFLEDITLVEDTIYNDSKDAVKLMTIPATKGEEFKTVFLIGFEDGIFPSYLSIFEDKENEIEEERRLLYVALTRAKDEMFITTTKSRIKNGQVNHNKVSRFASEFPEELVENKKKKRVALDANTLPTEDPQLPNISTTWGKRVEAKVKFATSEDKMSFNVGEKLKHNKFGTGKIREITKEGDRYQFRIKFDDGERKLMYFDQTASLFKRI